MKQQVNLYVEELRPRRVPLPFVWIAVLWGVVLLGLLGFGVWLEMEGREAARQLERLTQTRENFARQVAEAEARLKARHVSPDLLAEQDALRQELRRARAFNSQVAGRLTRSVSRSPSAVMTSLARQVDTSWLWLTAFRMDRSGQLVLEGRTLSPKRLPEWLDALGREGALKGATFSFLEARKAQDEAASAFRIAARPPEADGRAKP